MNRNLLVPKMKFTWLTRWIYTTPHQHSMKTGNREYAEIAKCSVAGHMAGTVSQKNCLLLNVYLKIVHIFNVFFNDEWPC